MVAVRVAVQGLGPLTGSAAVEKSSTKVGKCLKALAPGHCTLHGRMILGVLLLNLATMLSDSPYISQQEERRVFDVCGRMSRNPSDEARFRLRELSSIQFTQRYIFLADSLDNCYYL